MSNYFEISGTKAIGFYGDTNYLYDIYFEPQTWSILEINKRKRNEPKPCFKGRGHIRGLEVWDILEMIKDNELHIHDYKQLT